jgi:hypothetical protein
MRAVSAERAAILVTGIFLATLATGAPAGAEGVFAGACTLDVDVTYSEELELLPGPRTLQLDGVGTCVVNGAVAPLVLQGVAATTPLTGGYACGGGVATGTGVVDIALPGFPDPVVQLAIVDTGGVVTMTVLALYLTFDGVAELVREPSDTLTCGGSWATTTWTGAMAFQDPYPPPVR